MRPLRLAALTLTALLAFAAAAPAAVYDVSRVLRDDVKRVAKRTDVPIRLPARLNLDYDKGVFGSGSGSKRRYAFGIDATDVCGANVCFLAQLSGERGGTPAFKRTVQLTDGITGYYKPLTCGGSCSPPMIQWLQGGVLYSIQAKIGSSKPKRSIVRAANSAIRSTPR